MTEHGLRDVESLAGEITARLGGLDSLKTEKVKALRCEFPRRIKMGVKGLSWTPHELSKRDPKAVCKFLGEHESVLAPRVLREVPSKLSTGLKNPRRK